MLVVVVVVVVVVLRLIESTSTSAVLADVHAVSSLITRGDDDCKHRSAENDYLVLRTNRGED